MDNQLVNVQGILPSSLATLTLAQAYSLLGGDRPSDIPFIIWLMENPDSPLALPGQIYLKEHDFLHLLLGKGFSLEDEAFVIGFTMGNDTRTKWWHLLIYELVSILIYPEKFKFTQDNFEAFKLGLSLGKNLPIRNLNKFDFTSYQYQEIAKTRAELGI